jgi:hypothetical protein
MTLFYSYINKATDPICTQYTLEHVLWEEKCQTKATVSEKRGRNSRSFEVEREPTKTMEASIRHQVHLDVICTAV